MNKNIKSLKLTEESKTIPFIQNKKLISKKNQKKHKLPLEIMILIMNKAMEDDDFDKALEIAYKAAPYCHPKLNEAKVETKQIKTIENMTTEELKLLIGNQC